jgi:hypothetical protein
MRGLRLALVMVLLPLSVAHSALGLGEPSPRERPPVSRGGLTLGPTPATRPAPPPPGGLSLHPLPPTPPRPLPAPPPIILPPLPPPFQPPALPPIPVLGLPCASLQWDYSPNPILTLFQILVSRTSGTYTATDVRAMIPAIPQMHTEYACDGLYLSTNGTYYAVVQAVGFNPETGQVMTSDSSNELCLMVQDRQVYGCPGSPTAGGTSPEEPPPSAGVPPLGARGIPVEIMELCTKLRSQIVNQGDSSVVGMISTDIIGQPRSAGGGVDIGAIECDGAGSPSPPPSRLPPPRNFRMVPRS